MDINIASSSASFTTPREKRALLVASNLSHSFDYTLFENVDLEIKEGQSIAVLGVSGSGKSTLLHILATLLKPQKGRVLYKKRYLYEQDTKELLDIRRNDMGIIFQSHYLFKGFSVKENLEISSIIASKKIDDTLLKALGIYDNLHQNVADLSGGQQQRVSIARVLMKKPKLIFADEPTGNLDRETADEVMDVMLSYTIESKGGLFIVTHDERVASRCDIVYRLKDKRLVPVIL
jgi:putative ABC transport system ATP-binding protein